MTKKKLQSNIHIMITYFLHPHSQLQSLVCTVLLSASVSSNHLVVLVSFHNYLLLNYDSLGHLAILPSAEPASFTQQMLNKCLIPLNLCVL